MMVKLGNEWEPRPEPEPTRNALQVATNFIVMILVLAVVGWYVVEHLSESGSDPGVIPASYAE